VDGWVNKTQEYDTGDKMSGVRLKGGSSNIEEVLILTQITILSLYKPRHRTFPFASVIITTTLDVT